MFGALPGLSFKLFGFPVTIGADYAILALLLSIRARPDPLYLLEWIAVLTFSILLHELGHGFAYRRYSIYPQIRLWGLGGLTISGFPLPPRKSIVVSVAGPGVGIVTGIAILVLARWLPDQPFLTTTAADLVWVNLGWAILNLLPIAGLDGGNIVRNLFLLARGERGRRPALILVAMTSIAIAVVAAFSGFLYLSIIVLLFAFIDPAPYLELWRIVQPSGAGPRFGSRFGSRFDSSSAEPWRVDRRPDEPVTVPDDRFVPRRRGGKVVVGVGPDVRRRYGETYAETLEEPVDIEELESRPEPLLADASDLLHRRDDRALADRLVEEEDELSVLAIVARAVEAGRSKNLVHELGAGGRRPDAARGRARTALKVQVALHALGRYEDAIAAGRAAGDLATPTAENRLLIARSAARQSDRKQTRDALDQAISLGLRQLSDAALGDLARLGPDTQVAALLARLRETPPR